MDNIIDIFGTVEDLEGKYDYIWRGRIIVGSDQRFEGIVSDFYQEHISYLVFGKMDEESLSLTQCAKEDQELAHQFECTKANRQFDGEYSAKNAFAQIPVGQCRIFAIPAEKTREQSDWELNRLRSSISQHIDSLGETGRILHQEFLGERQKHQEAQKQKQKTEQNN